MKTIKTRPASVCGWVAHRINRKAPATLLAMFSLALLWTFDAHAQGIIWSVNFTPSYVGNEPGGGPVPGRQIGIDHVSNPDFPILPSLNPVSGIFSMIIFTNDAGRTFFANALNESGFTGFVAGLTDGANDYIRISEFGATTFGVGREADVLRRSSLSPDLAGYNITQIGFRVNSYYDWFYAPENSWQNTLDYSLDFYGSAVPEPSTCALLALGAAALLMRRKACRLRRP